MIIKHEHLKHMHTMLQDTISNHMSHITKLSDHHSEISDHYRDMYSDHLHSMVAHLEEVKRQYEASHSDGRVE